MSTRTSDSIEISVMRTLCKRFKTGYAKGLDLSSKSGILSYLSSSIDPNSYTDPSLFSKDCLLNSFLRKWKGWDVGIDCDKAGYDSWITAERLDFVTNNRLANTSLFPFGALCLISKIQRKIERVIGMSPVFDELDSLCKWGPGATCDIHHGSTDAAYKMSYSITVTADAAKHMARVIDDVWLSALQGSPFTIVRGNRVVMVPKNSKTHRVIAAEPTGNSFLQQGVGRYFRKCLKGFGVNLDDQSINQRLAFSCLVDNNSTLDLSSASDTLCRNLVHLLLPPAWASYLEEIRSPLSYFKGKWYHLQKFSSMGNAFTFELETLIFWAICSVVNEGRGPVSAYGDDLIVPQSGYRETVAALNYFGFVVNEEKSFHAGLFFESCGKYYHSLEDVTPAFQKEVVGKQLSELIRMHNRLYRWGVRTKQLHLVRDALTLIVNFTSTMHPKLKRLPRIPLNEEDSGFITVPSDLIVNRNGDFICWTLQEYSVLLHMIVPREILAFYAYKLRRPQHSNDSPDGAAALNVEHRTRLTKRVVWASSTTLLDSGTA